MKTKKIIKILCLLLFSIIFSNCENESTIQSNADPAVIEAKNWLEKNNPKLTILNYTKQIDWNQAIITDGSKGKVVEVPITLNNNTEIKKGDKIIKSYNRLMFIKDNKLTYKLSHVLITSEKENFDVTDEKFNFYNIKTDFEGTVTILNIDDKMDYYGKISKKNATSTSNKTNLEEQTCTYVIKTYDDGSYDVMYLLYCTGGSGDNGGGSGGGSGGYGDNPNPEPTPCEESIEELINSSYPTSELLESTIKEENSATRKKIYKWAVFKGPGFTINSSETGIHQKASNNNPSLQWEWVSLTHNNLYSEGNVIGFDLSFSLVSADPTPLGSYNYAMNLNYNVNYSGSLCGIPFSKKFNYDSAKSFNVNE
ncbi:hypothetical protein [Flavobacterium anhuiense]|uniref:hypothetical protein n=1 Tax=Flavobacterium anhuiense TaxID=459526 RepID=UPI00202720C1|nr:hypothetical protein [Flavobacterium anhuiense]URM38891.1 hypothetical protein LLY39_10355 [Flavobacterium anhuiense]